MKSFPCEYCGRGTVRSTYVTEVIELNGRRVLVKGVPIGLCPKCGHRYYDEHVMNRARELASRARGKRTVLYTNEYAIPGVPDACPEDEKQIDEREIYHGV